MKKKIIAITGGIGSGKSLALNILRQAGYKAVSCDEITAELYKKISVKEEIGKIFPSAVSGGSRLHIDKKEIARQAFSCEEKRERLNALLHPLIMSAAIRRAKRTEKNLSFVEVPLLFETKSESLFDGVIVILRDKVKRIESVKNRSDLTEEEILKRIDAQYNYESESFSGCIVIYNDKDKENFRNSVLKAIENL